MNKEHIVNELCLVTFVLLPNADTFSRMLKSETFVPIIPLQNLTVHVGQVNISIMNYKIELPINQEGTATFICHLHNIKAFR